MNAVYQEMGPCVCGDAVCAQIGTKLSKALDENTPQHLVGCRCIRHRNRNNKRKGRASEARAWKQLGGVGMTRTDDTYHPFPLEFDYENKVGDQIPAKFIEFVNSATFDKWIRQAAKKIPVGESALPALRLELTPCRAYLVVDISPRKNA